MSEYEDKVVQFAVEHNGSGHPWQLDSKDIGAIGHFAAWLDAGGELTNPEVIEFKPEYITTLRRALEKAAEDALENHHWANYGESGAELWMKEAIQGWIEEARADEVNNG